jgi:hypothetical protein
MPSHVARRGRTSLQRELFRAALSHVGKRDLVNAVLEVDLVGAIASVGNAHIRSAGMATTWISSGLTIDADLANQNHLSY